MAPVVEDLLDIAIKTGIPFAEAAKQRWEH
jgi:hypothetical protein